MQINETNENGVYRKTSSEIVARHGRSYAEISLAFCDDGLYRCAVSLSYSYGGYFSPIFASTEPFSTSAAARTAALEELLESWPKAWPTEPASVHEELRIMRMQVQSQLSQPSLF